MLLDEVGFSARLFVANGSAPEIQRDAVKKVFPPVCLHWVNGKIKPPRRRDYPQIAQINTDNNEQRRLNLVEPLRSRSQTLLALTESLNSEYSADTALALSFLLDFKRGPLAGISLGIEIGDCNAHSIIAFRQRSEIKLTGVGNASRILATSCFDSKGRR